MFGGMQRGLSLTEILNAPAWLIQDFSFITGVVAEEHARLRREKRQREGVKARRKRK